MYTIIETFKNGAGEVVNEIALTDECQSAGCEYKLDEPQEIDFYHWHAFCLKCRMDLELPIGEYFYS